MTPLQWLFHYTEVTKYRNRELEFLNNLTDMILDRLETLWFVVDPKIGKQLIELLKKGTIKQGEKAGDISPENFEEKWKEILANIPSTLNIPDSVDRRGKGAYKYPTFSKEKLTGGKHGIEVDY